MISVLEGPCTIISSPYLFLIFYFLLKNDREAMKVELMAAKRNKNDLFTEQSHLEAVLEQLMEAMTSLEDEVQRLDCLLFSRRELGKENGMESGDEGNKELGEEIDRERSEEWRQLKEGSGRKDEKQRCGEKINRQRVEPRRELSQDINGATVQGNKRLEKDRNRWV